MARRRNYHKTEATTIATTSVQRAYLATLVKTGLYGKSEADAAERLVSVGLQALVKEGTLRLLEKEGARELKIDHPARRAGKRRVLWSRKTR
jgi:hypothetical protein